MNMLTVDEILDAGFKFIPAEFINVIGAGKEPVIVAKRFLVHNSVVINRVSLLHIFNNRLEIQGRPPHIEYYTPAAEWRAYAGAMTFHLTNEIQLWRFMKSFDYPLPIDK